jgi:hypothetical protein
MLKTTMYKGLFFLFLIAIIMMVGCDQTIIIHKDKDGLGIYNYNPTSYHHTYYREGSYPYREGYPQQDPIILSQTGSGKVTKDPKSQNSGSGYTTPLTSQGSGTTTKDPKDSGMGKVYDISNKDTAKQQRSIQFQIVSDYPGGELTPDQILVNNRQFKPGTLFNPGNYSYKIEADGYATIEKNFVLPEQKEPFIIKETMNCLDREIRFKITDANTGAAIQPDKVLLKEKEVKEKDKIRPGKYALQIHKKNYQSVWENVYEIPVGQGHITITKKMNPAEPPTKKKLPKIRWEIVGNFPDNEPIAISSVFLNNKEVREGNEVAPGSYTAVIKCPGYETWSQPISVPDQEVYLLKAKLIGAPRLVQAEVFYDVPPSTQQSAILGPFQVLLRNINTNQTIEVLEGTTVLPANYEVTIRRKAYYNFTSQVIIKPNATPFDVFRKLEAKVRVVEIDVEYDIEPTAEIPEPVVDFIVLETGTRQTLKQGNTIKPGKYSYEVSQPGYKMRDSEDKNQITIEPDESAFRVPNAFMEALPRKIIFDTTHNGISVRMDEVLINNQRYQSTALKPGDYNMTLKFQNFQEVNETITIPAGSGDYIVHINMIPK